MECLKNEIVEKMKRLYPAGVPGEIEALFSEYEKSVQAEESAFRQYMEGEYDEAGVCYFATADILEKNTELARSKLQAAISEGA